MIERPDRNFKMIQLDEQDLNLYLAGVPWRSVNGYPGGSINGRAVSLHKVIGQAMGLKGIVHHDDKNRYNVQRSNLKPTGFVGNNRNQSLSVMSTSGITGISWNKRNNRWVASLSRKSLGSFIEKADAIAAREAAVIARDAAPIVRTLGLAIRRVIDETPKELFLTCGKTVLVCEGDWFPCLRYKWCFDGRRIVATEYPRPQLHRFIAEMMGLLSDEDNDEVIDHKFGNIFDCTREHLRRITPLQNAQNRTGKRISWDSRKNRWRGYVTLNGIRYLTKSFHYEHEAAEALDILIAQLNPQFRREAQ